MEGDPPTPKATAGKQKGVFGVAVSTGGVENTSTNAEKEPQL